MGLLPLLPAHGHWVAAPRNVSSQPNCHIARGGGREVGVSAEGHSTLAPFVDVAKDERDGTVCRNPDPEANHIRIPLDPVSPSWEAGPDPSNDPLGNPL